MPDFTCLDENLFAKVAQTLLQHISSTHCNFKSVLGPSILLLCVRLADVQMNGFINYCALILCFILQFFFLSVLANREKRFFRFVKCHVLVLQFPLLFLLLCLKK